MKPLSLSKPHLIVMVGIPGAGKSMFAEHFADTFKALLVSSSLLQDAVGKDKISEADAHKAANFFLDQLFMTGATIIYDGAASTRTQRQELAKKAHAHDYTPIYVWVQTDPVEARHRATRKGGLSETEYESRLRRFSVPHQTERAVVISGKHTYPNQLKIVLKRLSEGHQEAVTQSPVPERTSVAERRNIMIR
jgi:predicted kinase